jgi:NTE family protein
VSEPAIAKRTGFVLGGGGKWGAVEVGMLDALVEHGIRPDLIVGCSIGAINGAAFAAQPDRAGIDRLRQFWLEASDQNIIDSAITDRIRAVVGRRSHLFDTDQLRSAIEALVGDSTFADLRVPYQCVASSIEHAAEHWFDSGPLTPALLASSAIPVLFPAVKVGDEHFYDGGLVNSIPIDRAVELGATTVYVLQVGRIEEPLEPPRRLYEAGLVAFELARRHRFATFRRGLPDHLELHLLPSGNRLAMDDRRQLSWRRMNETAGLIERARAASAEYLQTVVERVDQ